MPHQSGHVILSLSTPVNSDKPKLKVWHCVVLISLVAFIAGVIAGALIVG